MTSIITLVCIFAINISLLHAETVLVELVEADDFVPLVNLRGTKLYTGIYYKVGMKAFPHGWVTWSERSNYIQVELNPSELPKYEEGQVYQYDNQWSFGMSESDLGYTVMNRGKPLGSLLWVNAGAGTGNHISVYDDAESIRKMAAGGEWRNDALWIPISTDEENYYKLENLAMRGRFLTWTYKKHNQYNYYVQMATYDAKEDAKFSFNPKAIKLEAKVFDFKFEGSMDEILKRSTGVTKSFLAKKTIPNASGAEIISNVKESTTQTVQVTFNFKESFKMVQKTTIDTVDQLLSFDGGFKANQDRSIETTNSVSLDEDIKIAPYTIIKANFFTTTVNNIEIPFTAKMLVVGLAERMLKDRPGETREAKVPADFVQDFMMSSGSSKMEIISSTGNDLIVRVSGTFKANKMVKLSMDTIEVNIFTTESTNPAFIWD